MSIFDIHSIRNHPDWNTFDLSKQSKFTAKLGMLLPVSYREVLPGDKVDLDLSHYTQTLPLNTNAFTRLKEHFDVFYVPFRLLYDKANEALVDVSQPMTADVSNPSHNVVHPSLPWTTFFQLKQAYNNMKSATSSKTDIFGFDRAENMARLLQYLGYGDVKSSEDWANIPLSIMPIATYNKIYQDFFRNQQWEDNNPYSYNHNFRSSAASTPITAGDLLGTPQFGSNPGYGNSMLDIRYVNYVKDYLFGILPSQVNDVYLPTSNASFVSKADVTGQMGSMHFNTGDNYLSTTVSNVMHMKDFSSNISVLQIRAAYALQKWSEVQLFSDKNYKDKIKHHFNVDVPDYTANLAQYCGGCSNVIQINDVINNNLSDGGQASRAGVSNGASATHVHYEPKEHGIIMVMYYVTPYVDYSAKLAFDPQVTHVSADDFPKPEFDKLGLQPVYKHTFKHSSNADDVPLGYAPRYWDFKSAIDNFYGGFAEDSMKSYVLSKDMAALGLFDQSVNAIKYYWFKVSPKDIDNIFVAAADDTYDTDVFLCNLGVDCKIERALSYNGMPY